MRFALDADAVGAGAGPGRERVAAHRGGLSGARDPERQVLPGLGGRGRAAVGRLQVDRRDGAGLADDPGHPQRPEPGPRRAGPGRRLGADVRPGGLAAVAGRGEQVPEGLLPAGAQRRDADRPAQHFLVFARQVEQRVRVGHRQRVRAGPGFDDLVAGLDLAFVDDPHVEAGAMVTDQQRREPGLAQPQTHPVARDPRLGDLEFGRPDAVPVTDAHVGVGQPVDGQVLAEVAVAEVVAAEMALPVPVGVDLVDQHRPLLAAVAGQVALPVAVDIQPADHGRAVYRLLPYAGIDRLALPRDVARQADVHRQQHRHPGAPLRRGIRRPGIHRFCPARNGINPGPRRPRGRRPRRTGPTGRARQQPGHHLAAKIGMEFCWVPSARD